MSHVLRPEASLLRSFFSGEALCAGLLIASMGGAVGAGDGPGLPALTYKPEEMNTVLSRIDAAVGSPNGHSLATMFKGYLVIIGSRDGGRGQGNLSFVDVSDPRKPLLVKALKDNTTTPLRECHAMAFGRIDGKDVAATLSQKGVILWDWTDVQKPTVISVLDLPGLNGGDYASTPWFLAWQGRHLFMAGTNAGLMIVDATDLAKPVMAGPPISINNLGGFPIGTVFAVGNQLFLTPHEKGNSITTCDISDPAKPMVQAISSKTMPGPAYAAMFNGGYLYFAGLKNLGVFAVDVRDPAAPTLAGIARPADGQERSSVNGGYISMKGTMAFCGMSSEFWMADFADPKNPKMIRRGSPGLYLKTAGKAVPHGDYDFLTQLGNLMISSSDHGDGSYLIPWQEKPDTTPPAMNYAHPADGAKDIAVTSRFGLTFDDHLDFTSCTATTIQLTDASGAAVPCRHAVQLGTVNVSPMRNLKPGTRYTLTFKAGGVRDLSGNALAKDVVITATTKAGP